MIYPHTHIHTQKESPKTDSKSNWVLKSYVCVSNGSSMSSCSLAISLSARRWAEPQQQSPERQVWEAFHNCPLKTKEQRFWDPLRGGHLISTLYNTFGAEGPRGISSFRVILYTSGFAASSASTRRTQHRKLIIIKGKRRQRKSLNSDRQHKSKLLWVVLTWHKLRKQI